jgi:hypothetical protein
MWQDYFFGLAGALYTAVLLPTCLNPKSEVPRSSSALTASMLAVSGVVYATLGMWWAASTCWADAVAWAFLFARRPIRPSSRILTYLREHAQEIREGLEIQPYQSGGLVSERPRDYPNPGLTPPEIT